MKFYVLDFEIANRDKSSICQAGLVEYDNGEITTLIDEYINPLSDFDMKSPYFYRKHNISKDDVKGALTFEEFYPELKNLIENKTVFNHNMSDKRFFEAACLKFNQEVFKVEWLNSLSVVQRAWIDLEGGHSIENLADFLSIKYIPHNAASDCFATAKIIEAACKKTKFSIDDWKQKINSRNYTKRGSINANSNGFEDLLTNKYNFSERQSMSGELLKAPNLNDVENKQNPFYNKRIVVSGTYKNWPDRKELALLLKRNGAKICSNMGRGKARRDILCAGEGVGAKKIEIMNEMISNGSGGQILDEAKILELISEYNLK